MALTLKTIRHRVAMGLGIWALSASAYAGWALDNQQSVIDFSSVKNDAVVENHGFKQLSGTIDDKGAVTLTIALDSVDTNIEIRDTRMKEMLFQTKTFPNATISANVDGTILRSLAPGTTRVDEVTFTLDLHGKTQDLPAKVQITGLEGGGLLVNTLAPVMVMANQFDLDGGVTKLKEVAKLKSILLTVPVNATLVFKPAT
ncbi:YceI family protein [Photobacterium aphoticum]|nr:YceI family protein [Photobacterium aphoticum]PSU56830.1 YceI family protein [Photobacterium aphoticum]GHA40806.1 hypothetical protein GCM10007086_13040 [Photobacterium aphoticum]